MNLKRFPKNTEGKDWVVGDIHGCYSILYNELKKINFDESKDRLFSVGDLVDRGPESIDVLDIINKSWFHAVLGNHDLFACEYYAYLINKALDLGYINNYAANGGKWFLDLDIGTQKIIAKHFALLPVAIEVETDNGLVGIVHADCPYNDWNTFVYELVEADRELVLKCVWNRDRIRNRDNTVIQNIHKVYHGHSVVKTDVLLGNRHYIDTGAVFNNYLTIREL